MKTENKKFSTALIVWLLFGAIGGHKVYIEERFHYVFWYFLFTAVTLGLAPIIGAFRMKSRILEVNAINRAYER